MFSIVLILRVIENKHNNYCYSQYSVYSSSMRQVRIDQYFIITTTDLFLNCDVI